MSNYKDWLRNRLIENKDSLDFNKYNIDVYDEQEYAKKRSIQPNTITVIVKMLPSSLIYQAKTQPIQMLVITEENSISVANSIVTKFCESYNFVITTESTTYTKHIYSTPAVLSNFNLIGIGLRTVLYVNVTLLILDNVMDISNVRVNGLKIEPMSATIGYTMSGDTQPFDGGYAQTEKNFATFVMTLNVACIKNAFTELCIKIMNGTSSEKGNETFTFNFDVGDLPFENFKMKLVGVTLSTAVNNVPSLQLSFSV